MTARRECFNLRRPTLRRRVVERIPARTRPAIGDPDAAVPAAATGPARRALPLRGATVGGR